ncbi:MAG: hypothetical protein NDI63_05965 [Pseudobdellovibrio sp.]|nr:hypothetical protein [Pseudobdellovibrio sp.]
MKKLIRRIIIMAIIMGAQISSAQTLEPLEPIYGYIQASSGIFFQVASGGCTYSDEFFVQVKRNADIDTVILIREHFDPCKAYMPYGVTIFKSYDDLGIQDAKPFKILNPIRTLRRIR